MEVAQGEVELDVPPQHEEVVFIVVSLN